MLKLSSWHKKFGRKDMQSLGGVRKFGITSSLQKKLRRKSFIAKEQLANREPIEAPRDVLQEEFMHIKVPESKCSYGDTCMHEGIELMKIQSYRMAVEAFSKALIKDPNHFHCRFYRAVSYATVGRYRWARADFLQCQKAEPENLSLIYNLALASLNCHMHNRASKLLKTGCKLIDEMKASKHRTLNPEIRDNIWRLRGLVNRRRGAYNDARTDYVALHRINEHVDRGNYEEDLVDYRQKLQMLCDHMTLSSRTYQAYSWLFWDMDQQGRRTKLMQFQTGYRNSVFSAPWTHTLNAMFAKV